LKLDVLDRESDARRAVQRYKVKVETIDSRGGGEVLEVNRGCGANKKYDKVWLRLAAQPMRGC